MNHPIIYPSPNKKTEPLPANHLLRWLWKTAMERQGQLRGAEQTKYERKSLGESNLFL
jgi:hypothetical protein